MGHHLLTKHTEMQRVKNISMMPAKSTERILKMALLVNEGNFLHNIKLLIQERNGTLTNPDDFFVVKRRSKVS